MSDNKKPIRVGLVGHQFMGVAHSNAFRNAAIGRKNHNCIEINGQRGSLYWGFAEQNYLYFYDKTRPVAEQGFTKINATYDTHPYGGGPWPQGHGIGYGCGELANRPTSFQSGEITHVEQEHDPVAQG